MIPRKFNANIESSVHRKWIILKSNVNCTWMNNLSASLIKFHRIVSSILYSKYIINIRSQSRVQIVTYKYWNIEIYILYTLLIKSYKYMYIFLRIKRFKIVHADTFYIITMMGIKLLKWLQFLQNSFLYREREKNRNKKRNKGT